MISSIGYIKWHYPEKQDIIAQKLGSHCELKDRHVT